MKELFSLPLQKLQIALQDAAKLGSKEMHRGLQYAKENIARLQLVQRRKELFSELGRTIYEARGEKLPSAVTEFFKETEIAEILQEIEQIDEDLKRKILSSEKPE